MLEDKLKRLFESYGAIIVDRMIDKMNNLDLNATGTAARSLKYVARPDGLSIMAKSYFAQIDKGREPKGPMPPISPIMKWVQRKLAVADPREQRKVAYAVQKTIAERGTIKRFGYKGADILDYIIRTEIKSKFQPEIIRVVKDDLLLKARELKKNINSGTNG